MQLTLLRHFYGACVPNVLWFISIFPLQCVEVIWLNYYLTVFRIMLYVISRWLMCTLIIYFKEIFMLGKTGCYNCRTEHRRAWVKSLKGFTCDWGLEDIKKHHIQKVFEVLGEWLHRGWRTRVVSRNSCNHSCNSTLLLLVEVLGGGIFHQEQ